MALLWLAGCSSGDRSRPGGADTGSDSGAASTSSLQSTTRGDVGRESGGKAPAAAADVADTGSADQPAQASVISTGEVSLSSRDVGAALGEVRDVVRGYGGSVQREATDTDDHGTASSSYLTVRVPSSDFAAAMADLGRVATLVSTSSRSKDVTTVVLDNDVRVRVAQKSIDRISTLLDQATSIRDVISIESELSQRQADLASLESQQKYLADQTSMATITVSIDHRSGVAPKPNDHTGFAAGLGAGWHALATTASGVATGAGAVLPWLVVVVVVAIPVRLVLRRRGRGRPAQAA